MIVPGIYLMAIMLDTGLSPWLVTLTPSAILLLCLVGNLLLFLWGAYLIRTQWQLPIRIPQEKPAPGMPPPAGKAAAPNISYINHLSQLLVPMLAVWQQQAQHGSNTGSENDTTEQARRIAQLEFVVGEINGTPATIGVTRTSLLELIDETLDALRPLVESTQTRIHILLDGPTRIACKATCLKGLLLMILLSNLHSRAGNAAQTGSMTIQVSYDTWAERLIFQWTEDWHQSASFLDNPRFQYLLAETGGEWQTPGLSLLASHPQDRTLPPGTDSALTAIIISDDPQERQSLQQRLDLLGIATTVELDVQEIDLCLVSGNNYRLLSTIIPSMQDSTCMVTLHEAARQVLPKNAFHRALDYPLSQAGLANIVQEIKHRKHQTHTRHGVLLVDDSPFSVQQPARLLTELGYSVISLPSGHAALATMASKQFQMVLMDIQMPGLDGVETTRLIRQRDTRTPIIGLTAHASDEERQAYLDAGMNHVLTKPVYKEDLSAALAEHTLSQDSFAPLATSAPKPPVAARPTTRVAIFDFDLALNRANGKPAVMEELMALFMEGLAADRAAIMAVAEDPKQLQQALHRLRGALSYCGLPRLARAVESVEIPLKDSMTETSTAQVKPLVTLLYQEIDTLMDWYEVHKKALKTG